MYIIYIFFFTFCRYAEFSIITFSIDVIYIKEKEEIVGSPYYSRGFEQAAPRIR